MEICGRTAIMRKRVGGFVCVEFVFYLYSNVERRNKSSLSIFCIVSSVDLLC